MSPHYIPPRGIFIPSRILYHSRLPPVVAYTWMQLRGLAWGRTSTPPLSILQLIAITDKSQACLFDHLARLKRAGLLSWRTDAQSNLIITFPDEPFEKKHRSPLPPAAARARYAAYDALEAAAILPDDAQDLEDTPPIREDPGLDFNPSPRSSFGTQPAGMLPSAPGSTSGDLESFSPSERGVNPLPDQLEATAPIPGARGHSTVLPYLGYANVPPPPILPGISFPPLHPPIPDPKYEESGPINSHSQGSGSQTPDSRNAESNHLPLEPGNADDSGFSESRTGGESRNIESKELRSLFSKDLKDHQLINPDLLNPLVNKDSQEEESIMINPLDSGEEKDSHDSKMIKLNLKNIIINNSPSQNITHDSQDQSTYKPPNLDSSESESESRTSITFDVERLTFNASTRTVSVDGQSIDPVSLYTSLTSLTPTPIQEKSIRQFVNDLELWEDAIQHHLWHHWNPGNVAIMLELYRRGGTRSCFICSTTTPPPHGRLATLAGVSLSTLKSVLEHDRAPTSSPGPSPPEEN